MDADAKIDMRSLDLAHSLALTELIRFALIEIALNDDRAGFRNRLRKIEEGIVTSIGSRRHYSGIDDQEEAVIREAACGFLTRLIGSIPAPGGRK
jgi:hypothetical protein